MPGTATLDDVYSAIEETARLLDVPCSRERVWPILSTYGDTLAQAIVGFSMAAGAHHSGELDYSLTVPAASGDPYAVALAQGFTTATDHPVGTLLAGVRERCPLRGYAVDSGVVGGFKKIWSVFPLEEMQALPKIADIPGMPPALAAHADLFARHDLDERVTMLGADYQRRTMNVYFGRFPAGFLSTDAILSLLAGLGLPAPDGEELTFLRRSFSIYPTFNWDSGTIERVCFAVVTREATALPARLEPEIARFAAGAPYRYDGDRILVYGATVTAGGIYYKTGSYYQLPPEMWQQVQAFDALRDQA